MGIVARLLPYGAVFVGIQTLLRLSLLARAWPDLEPGLPQLLAVVGMGLYFDLVTASFCLLPLLLYHLLLPARLHGGRFDRRFDAASRQVFCFVLLFDAVAEHLFWTEFATRFNFIAVDYLIYTQEVIGNIVESYPVSWIILGIAPPAWAVARASRRAFPLRPDPVPLRRRAAGSAAWACMSGLLYLASASDQARLIDNAEAREVAANGIYNLFAAAWNNEISYERFYLKERDYEVDRAARRLLSERGEKFLHEDLGDLTRVIESPGPELRRNVVVVVMESMSAEYMGVFGGKGHLTPNLDRLASEGLLFSNAYATGTRTVRGLEAVTLSVPPTPGQSIVRRPGNGGLFSLGFVFQDRGYDTSFLYGGYGYFDNMSRFFGANGFAVIDRNAMESGEVQFANVWGICDEDLFRRAIKEADASYAGGRPFMQLIMTTSNHRPYTYPAGRIDIAPRSGRLGGVKYADYSVGRLVEEARTRPWFKDTVFVFVADHTAGAGGKAELDPRKYHIPMIFYSPGSIAPSRYEELASQIDAGPILLGLLNFSYYTKFYGEDLLRGGQESPRAFVSNFQKVGLAREGRLTVLAPKRRVEQYAWPRMSPAAEASSEGVRDAVAYYQSASWWRERQGRIPTLVDRPKSLAEAAR